jgi:hypothetical protein
MRLRLHLRFLTSFSHAKIGIPIGIVIAIGSPQLDGASRCDTDPDTELSSLPPFIHQLTVAKPIIGYKPGGLDFPSNYHKLKCRLASFSG